jgi:uncharacterized membrane protein
MSLIDPAAAAELDRLLSDPAALAAKVSEVVAAARSDFAAREARIDAKMEQMIAQAAAAAAAHDVRERELRQREAHLVDAERQLAADRDRVYARERYAEERAAYLQQRLTGAA